MNTALKYLIFFWPILVFAPHAYSEKDAATLAEDPIVNYNKGVVSYRKDDFQSAKEVFTKALITENKALETKAEYNIGNSLFKMAKAAQESDPDRAMDALKQAAHYYQKAIELDPKDLDIKYNHELSQRLLKILQEKPRPQQQSKDQNKEQGKEQNNQGQQKNTPQNQQGEQQEDQQKQEQQQQQKDGQNKKEESRGRQKEEKLSEEEARMLASQFGQENLRLELNREKNNQEKTVSKDW